MKEAIVSRSLNPWGQGMAIDPVASGKGEKRTDAQDHGTEHLIANVEVEVGVTRPLPLDDAIARIFV